MKKQKLSFRTKQKQCQACKGSRERDYFSSLMTGATETGGGNSTMLVHHQFLLNNIGIPKESKK